MGNFLNGIALAVGKIVHWIDAPFVARAVVVGKFDAVQNGVAQQHIVRSHVYLGAQRAASFGKLAVFHAFKQGQVFGYRTAAVGAIGANFGGCSFLGGHLFGGEVVHVGQFFFDKLHRKFVQFIKIIGSIKFVFPLKTKPLHVIFDGFDVFGIFGNGVGIVEAQVGTAAVFLRHAKIQTNGFGVANVQIAVRFGREARQYLPAVFARPQVFFDDLLNKIQRFFFGG